MLRSKTKVRTLVFDHSILELQIYDPKDKKQLKSIKYSDILHSKFENQQVTVQIRKEKLKRNQNYVFNIQTGRESDKEDLELILLWIDKINQYFLNNQIEKYFANNCGPRLIQPKTNRKTRAINQDYAKYFVSNKKMLETVMICLLDKRNIQSFQTILSFYIFSPDSKVQNVFKNNAEDLRNFMKTCRPKNEICAALENVFETIES